MMAGAVAILAAPLPSELILYDVRKYLQHVGPTRREQRLSQGHLNKLGWVGRHTLARPCAEYGLGCTISHVVEE